ncbi:MAG: hypothetical protein ABI721_00615 [Candidatus Dojkabacteria bacterium]
MEKNLTLGKFFKNYKPGFDPYKLDVRSTYEWNTLSVVVKDGVVISNNSKLTTENSIVNLASTSKPFTMSLLSKSLNSDSSSTSSRLPSGTVGMTQRNKQFKATKDLVKELIFRKQYQHILQNPDYKEVIIWLNKNRISNVKSKLRAKLKGNDVGLYNWKAESFPEVSIDLNELCFNALTLSSNSAIEIARNKLEEIYGSDEVIQKALDGFNLAPTLELHKGGFKLLTQPRANSGDLKDIVKAFDRLVKKAESEPLLSAVKNNTVFFDVGISPFLRSQNKINSEVTVYEKTGVAWPICYGEEYVKLGFPPHMIMGTLFSIKMNHEVTSFGIFKVIAIAVPKTLDTNNFPNIYEKNYIPYINSVKYKFLKRYRTELINLVNSNINLNLENKLTVRREIQDFVKKAILRLQLLF